MRTVFLAMAAVCLLAPPLLAQGKFPLKYQDADDQDLPAMQMAMRFSQAVPDKPGDLKGVPEGWKDGVAYASLELAGKPVWMALMGGDSPQLLADTNGNGDLADEKAVAGTAQGPRIAFGIVEFTAEGKAPVRVRVEAQSPDAKAPPQFVLVRPAGLRTGEVKLGDRTCTLVVVDGNLDGRYGGDVSPVLGGGNADALGIDLNGDGRFDPPTLEADPWEVTPLAKGLRAGDKYYRLDVAADGSQVELAEIKPECGTLDLGAKDAQLVAMSDFGIQRIKTTDGKVSLPAGKYTAFALLLAGTDGAGAKWTLQGQPPQELQQFEVQPGKTLQAQVGPPLVLKTTAAQEEQAISISLALVGKGGETYSPGALKDNKRPPPPKFEILDEAGKVLQTGNFEYG